MENNNNNNNNNLSANRICYNFNKELIGVINIYGKQLPSYVIYLIIEKIYNEIKEKNDKILLSELVQETQERIESIPIVEKKEEEKE